MANVRESRRWAMAIAMMFVVSAIVAFIIVRRGDGPPLAPPGFVDGHPIDVIFDTTVPLFPGGYESSITKAENATDGETVQPVASALPGPDKTADVWVFQKDVGYRYGDDLVIQTTPYTITTDPVSHLRSHVDAFGGSFVSIGGHPARIRPAHSIEPFERQVDEKTLVGVEAAAIDTTIIEMIIGETEVTIFGLELPEAEALKVAESLH